MMTRSRRCSTIRRRTRRCPTVDVAVDEDEVSLVDDDSFAGDGVADPLDLSARESVR